MCICVAVCNFIFPVKERFAAWEIMISITNVSADMTNSDVAAAADAAVAENVTRLTRIRAAIMSSIIWLCELLLFCCYCCIFILISISFTFFLLFVVCMVFSSTLCYCFYCANLQYTIRPLVCVLKSSNLCLPSWIMNI